MFLPSTGQRPVKCRAALRSTARPHRQPVRPPSISLRAFVICAGVSVFFDHTQRNLLCNCGRRLTARLSQRNRPNFTPVAVLPSCRPESVQRSRCAQARRADRLPHGAAKPHGDVSVDRLGERLKGDSAIAEVIKPASQPNSVYARVTDHPTEPVQGHFYELRAYVPAHAVRGPSITARRPLAAGWAVCCGIIGAGRCSGKTGQPQHYPTRNLFALSR